jgi:prepilin-type N-terminal cleavage/methylation domain-containing protein
MRQRCPCGGQTRGASDASARPGFTLVELLTVIAIIAILAAIIFPVMSTVRRNVWKTQCTTNLHSIAQALKLYKDDWRVYPDALFGYVLPGDSQPRQTFLYPQYIKELSTFRCPLDFERTDNPTLLPGVDPVTGSAFVPWMFRSANLSAGVQFYAWDSYDGTRVPHPNGAYQVHYMRKWTPGNKPDFRDDPRQLLYRNPPDNTVVTWCTYHRFYSNGQPEQGSIDLVLFLDGHVKPTPSNLMVPTSDDPFRPFKAVPTP